MRGLASCFIILLFLFGCVGVTSYKKGPEWFTSHDIAPESINSTQSITKLIELLTSDNQQTREAAFNILRHGQPAPASGGTATAFGDKVEETKIDYQIVERPKLTSEIAEALATYSQKIGHRHVVSTASYLTENGFGKYSVPGLMESLNSDETWVRSDSALWLGSIGAEAARVIVKSGVYEVVSSSNLIDFRHLDSILKFHTRDYFGEIFESA